MPDEAQTGVDEQREADVAEHQEQPRETEDLGDKGKAALKAERDARRAAERERSELASRIAEFEKAQREADEAKAKEQGEWEKIAQQREAELAELKDTLTKREMSDKRRALARKHKVHEDDMELVDLITATDDDEVETWVKRIAKRSAVTDGLDTDSGKRSAQGNGKQKSESLLANYEFGKRR